MENQVFKAGVNRWKIDFAGLGSTSGIYFLRIHGSATAGSEFGRVLKLVLLAE
jgi:hypothetical protein